MMCGHRMHISAEVLEHLREGRVAPAEADAVGRHTAACADCAARVGDALSLRDAVASFDAAFGDADAPGPRGDEESILDRVAIASRRPQPRVRSWIAVAAAAAVALTVTAVLVRDDAPEETRRPGVTRPPTAMPAKPRPPEVVTRQVRPEWSALVAEARRSGVLPFPAELAELAGDETFRGAAGDAASRVSPSATAVDDRRPTFHWPAMRGASFIVTIARDGAEVAVSERLDRATWRPSSPLQRGAWYEWKVEMRRGEETLVLPSPPSPPAVFHVIDGRTHDELQAARREAADDPLLLGILHARAGLVDDARRELARSDDPLAARLLRQLPMTTNGAQ
jgi:hypothetical protein